MNGFDELSNALIWLIRAGAGLRGVDCYLKIMRNSDEEEVYKKRIRNVISFYILSEGIFQLKDIAIYYFKQGGI